MTCSCVSDRACAFCLRDCARTCVPERVHMHACECISKHARVCGCLRASVRACMYLRNVCVRARPRVYIHGCVHGCVQV